MKSIAFRHLWFGQALANLGDVLYIVGLISAVYTMTGSAVYMTAVPLIITFSRFVSSVVAPLLMNRTTLRALLAWSQAAKTALLFIVLFALQSLSVWPLLMLGAGIAFLDGWALPARNAFVPYLVKREELMGANGFLSTVDQIIQFSSWALGGVLLSLIGVDYLFVTVFILFLVSTVYMFRLPAALRTNLEERKSWWAQLGEGWVLVKEKRGLVSVFCVYALESIAATVWIAAVLYLYVDRQLGKGEEWWGFINSAFFIGLLLASIVIFRYHGLFSRKRASILPLTIIMTSVITLFFAWNELAILALVLSLLFGLFDQLKTIILQTYLQESAPPDELGKIYAAQGTLTTLLFGLSSAGAGLLVEKWSIPAVFTVSGILLALSIIPMTVFLKDE
ncbi:MFS transporter [Rossellomorea sp. RS05]|uniref:MFS transporter n=1 Tax=Rossellomorea sp. RS05 TaxID=3149166 RepID=UPI003221EEAE